MSPSRLGIFIIRPACFVSILSISRSLTTGTRYMTDWVDWYGQENIRIGKEGKTCRNKSMQNSFQQEFRINPILPGLELYKTKNGESTKYTSKISCQTVEVYFMIDDSRLQRECFY